jgi:hypothetical protein
VEKVSSDFLFATQTAPTSLEMTGTAKAVGRTKAETRIHTTQHASSALNQQMICAEAAAPLKGWL